MDKKKSAKTGFFKSVSSLFFRFMNIKRSIIAVFAVAYIVSSAVIITLFYNSSYKSVNSGLEQSLSNSVHLAADLLEIDSLERYGNEGSQLSPEYKAIWDRLVRIQESFQLTYLYILVVRDSNYLFIFDNETDPEAELDEGSNFFEPYEDYPDELTRAYEDGSFVLSDGTYTDEWGTFRSGFLGIKDTNGRPSAVIGADIDIKALQALYSRIVFMVFISMGILAAVLLLMTIVLRLTVFRRLYEFSSKVKDLSQGSGDLTSHLDDKRPDELGELAKWFNVFIGKLADSILSVKYSIIILLESSKKLAENTSSLAAGSEEQAASSEEALVTMETFTKTLESIRESVIKQFSIVDQTTEAIEKLSGISRLTTDAVSTVQARTNESVKAAQEGRKTIKSAAQENINMAGSLKEISLTVQKVGQNSENIDRILRVIKEIADQTNILAMNASIEASHAGQYGKGFAVVAREIKKLSEQSAQSVKDIEDLIKGVKLGIQSAVGLSVRGEETARKSMELSDKSQNALESILNYIGEIDQMVGRISGSVQEQGSATEAILKSAEELRRMSDRIRDSLEEQTSSSVQIMQTVDSITRSTSQNAALAGELSVMASDLKAESDELTKVTRQFRLEDDVLAETIRMEQKG